MKLKYLIIMLIILSNTVFALTFQKVQGKKYNYIYAIGKIYSGDLYRFKRVYNTLPKNKQTIVFLSSNGGELKEGIKLGKYFYRHRIATAVMKNSYCASSCALAFLGGRSLSGKKLMYLADNTRLGFHNFYYKNSNYVNAIKVQQDLSNLIEYFSYVKAPSSLMYKMLKTKPNNMFWISNNLHRNYLKTKRIASANSYATSNTNGKNSNTQYALNDKKEAIKNYFYNINNVIKANSGYMYDKSNYALNADNYKEWLGRNLSYVYVNRVNIKRNKAYVKVTYALKNGRRIYSNNTYILKRTQYGWRVVSKIVKPLRRYRKLARNLRQPLP